MFFVNHFRLIIRYIGIDSLYFSKAIRIKVLIIIILTGVLQIPAANHKQLHVCFFLNINI